MRSAGRIRGNKGGRWEVALADLYRKQGDPYSVIRHRGKTAYTDQFHFLPTQPALSPFAIPMVWEFKTAYDVNTTSKFLQTNSGAGTVLAVQDERGGFAKFTNGAADNNFYSYQSTYETGKLQSGKGLWFRTFMKIADADEADWFIGLAAKVPLGDLLDGRVDAIGFYGADGSASINFECRKDSTRSRATGLETLVDDTVVGLGFEVNSTTEVSIWVNDSRKGTIRANIPDDEELSFSFGCRNGQASANSMSVGTTILLHDE